MPKLIDVARLGRDAELRYLPDGTAVTNMALAMDYGKKDAQTGKRQTQWVEGSLWGKHAEALTQYLLKGQQVYVEVEDVHIEEYQSQGATRSKLVGKVSAVKLVGSAPAQQAASPQSARQPAPRQQAPQQQAPQQDYDSFDDPIPF